MTSDIQAITMPKWGLAMDEGMVSAWLVEEGAAVAAGDEVVEIETTKITNVFESPVAGTLRRRVVDEGESVPVGALLAVVAEPSADDAAIDAYVAEFQANFAVQAEAAAEAAPEPETIDAGGRAIKALRMGASGEESSSTPLVLIHGFGGDLNNWLFNQPALAEDREVIAIDLPGHGGSAKDVGSGDMAMLTATLGDVLDTLGIGQAHLAGHSMGGAVCLVFALKQPKRVASLSLIAPGGLGSEINMDFIEGFRSAARRKEMKGVLELLVADPSLISRDMVNDVLKYKRLDGVDGALEALARTLFPGGSQQPGVRDLLDSLQVPTQVIWGKQDRILPANHAEGLPAKVGVHLLECVGHMPHMEAASEVNRLIGELTAG